MTDYYPLYFSNGVIINSLLVHTLLHYYEVNIVSEYHFLIGLTVMAAISYAHIARTAALEIANELDIFIFRVNKPKST